MKCGESLDIKIIKLFNKHGYEVSTVFHKDTWRILALHKNISDLKISDELMELFKSYGYHVIISQKDKYIVVKLCGVDKERNIAKILKEHTK